MAITCPSHSAIDDDRSVHSQPPVPSNEVMLSSSPMSPPDLRHRLVAHYATSMTRLMVWVDSDKNQYRQLVVPLAMSQEALNLAILALAASHLAHLPRADVKAYQAASESALTMITVSIRNINGTSSDTEHIEYESAIAAALVLSNHSLLSFQPSLARTHLDAVRVLVKAASLNCTSGSDLHTFLQNQAAIHDVLNCTTVFNSEDINNAILPDLRNGNILFGKFLQVVHMITIMSLPKRAGSGVVSIGELEDELESARTSTLVVAAALNTSPHASGHTDFVQIAQAYHHAGVLYACTRIQQHRGSVVQNYHVSRLFHVFAKFQDLRTSVHNLAWPIFIAGVCAYPDEERMSVVTELVRIMVKVTHFWHYRSIVRFHQELWTCKHHDWIVLAQDWERRGILITAV